MGISNLECKLSTFTETDNSNLLKVKILVQHDGENKNGSKFSLDAIKKAEETIKNVPILAYIKKNEDGEFDFDEHNMITKIVEGEDGYKLTTQYLETPVGVIPSDTEITYEEIDNKNYMCVSGYIWKRYSNEGYDIIMNSEEKSVSMEIEIFKGEKDEEDGLYDIKEYQFLGVTCLGEDIEPGMYNTTIKKYSSSKSFKKELEDIYKEIISLKEREELNMAKEITVENEEEIVVEEVIEVEKTEIDPVVEPVEENFALSTADMGVSIQTKLKDRKIEVENYWGEKYSTREFYLETMIPDEKIVVLEDNTNYGNYYGVPYEIKGDDVELSFDAKVPYIQEWRAKKVDEVVEVFAKEDELKDIVLEKFAKKQIELDAMKVELESLKQFKEVKDKEDLAIKVEEVINEFNLQEEEVETFKANALEGKLGLDELKKELFCLVGMKALSSKEKFSAKEEVNEVKVMDVEKFSNEKVAYGGLFEKHGIK